MVAVLHIEPMMWTNKPGTRPCVRREVHIYCYWLLASLGHVHAYQTTSSDNIISIKPYML